MLRSMITAANTMSQLQYKLDVIGNNVANATTPGFKRRQATFSDLLYQQFNNLPAQTTKDKVAGKDFSQLARLGIPIPDDAKRLTPDGIRRGTGAKIAATDVVMAVGNMIETGRKMDVALTEPGQFFKVLANDNGVGAVRLTRDGSFSLSPSSSDATRANLVNGDGYLILDANESPITVPVDAATVNITPTGQVVSENTNGDIMEQSDLGIAKVIRPQMLENLNNNLYGVAPTDGQPTPVNKVYTDLVGDLREEIGVQQGFLEQSNVRIEMEMTDLIATQRSYQFNSRAISTADQMLGLINGLRS